MKLLFLAIQQYLLSRLSGYGVTYIRIWNNQLQELLDGKNETFTLKAIFIEFVSPMETQQLGNGVQTYDPLFIKVHIVWDFYDAQDGTMGQNLEVLDVANTVYKSFQDWMPGQMTIEGVPTYIPVGSMIRTTEDHDTDHANVYHFIQTYKTTWIDTGMQRPVGGSVTSPPIVLSVTIPAAWINGNLYVIGDEVTYLGSAYRCILDTTVLNEVPTNTTYWTLITTI